MDGVGLRPGGQQPQLVHLESRVQEQQHPLIIDPGCNSTNNANPVVTAGTVYDYRQATTMNTLDINVGALAAYAPAMAALLNPPEGSDPGILYVSSSSANGAVRLVNGAELPQNQVEGQAVGPHGGHAQPCVRAGELQQPAGNTTLRCLPPSWPMPSRSFRTLGGTVRTTGGTASTGPAPPSTHGRPHKHGSIRRSCRATRTPWAANTAGASRTSCAFWRTGAGSPTTTTAPSSASGRAKWPRPPGLTRGPSTIRRYGNWSFVHEPVNALPPGTPRVRITTRVGWSAN